MRVFENQGAGTAPVPSRGVVSTPLSKYPKPRRRNQFSNTRAGNRRRAGDVNGDGCVDGSDLLAVLLAFGNTGSGLLEDLNGDGIVDDADLLEVLFHFGEGC